MAADFFCSVSKFFLLIRVLPQLCAVRDNFAVARGTGGIILKWFRSIAAAFDMIVGVKYVAELAVMRSNVFAGSIFAGKIHDYGFVEIFR